MKVLVIGASDNPSRTSNQAIEMLTSYHHEVKAIGRKEMNIHGIDIQIGQPNFEDIDTVTLYVNPRLLEQFSDYIISLGPRRVIFNPGTEHPGLMKKFLDNSILVEEACTLVMLRTNQF